MNQEDQNLSSQIVASEIRRILFGGAVSEIQEKISLDLKKWRIVHILDAFKKGDL
jgi:hypothetical protein